MRRTATCVAATAAESTSVASAKATTATCVAAAAPATVLGESRMRRDGESGSESECGNQPPSRRRKDSPGRRWLQGARAIRFALVSRVAKKAARVMAIARAGKCDAGKLAFDCVVF